MKFTHIPAQRNPAIVLSYCSACRMLVAGTINHKLLAFAESLHQCKAGAKERVPDAKAA